MQSAATKVVHQRSVASVTPHDALKLLAIESMLIQSYALVSKLPKEDASRHNKSFTLNLEEYNTPNWSKSSHKDFDVAWSWMSAS